MTLLVWSVVTLSPSVKVDHSFSQWIAVATKSWHPLEHGSVERSINLFQRFRSWEVNINERSVPQEPIRHNLATNVRGWVASTNEHDAVQANPLLIYASPVAILLGHLPQERDHDLSSVFVTSWQVDLITEDY